jgi:hypothetical protein
LVARVDTQYLEAPCSQTTQINLHSIPLPEHDKAAATMKDRIVRDAYCADNQVSQSVAVHIPSAGNTPPGFVWPILGSRGLNTIRI